MGFIKNIIFGAALFGAYKYVTYKDKLTGRSVLDDIKDKAPKWVEKVKIYKTY